MFDHIKTSHSVKPAVRVRQRLPIEIAPQDPYTSGPRLLDGRFGPLDPMDLPHLPLNEEAQGSIPTAHVEQPAHGWEQIGDGPHAIGNDVPFPKLSPPDRIVEHRQRFHRA